VTVRIGITGPIGCGKSTVASWLDERAGVTVVDADHEARLVLAPGTPEVEAVYRRFGADLRRPNGELDRAALGRIVFGDPAALADLEAIVHPAVRPRILAAIERAERSGARAVVIEAIKLIEGGLAELCDEVWLVTCDPTTQRERLVGRGDAEEDATARVAAQGDLVERLRPRATRVIDTSGDAAPTRTVVDGLLDEALRPST
jgi:dephospho-CoA kinase